jgi:hypothetical protein
MSKPLAFVTSPPLMGVKGWLGWVWFWYGSGRRGVLWFGHGVWGTPLVESRVGSLRGFRKVSFELGFLLEFNFVGKGANLIKGGEMLEFHHIPNGLI